MCGRYYADDETDKEIEKIIKQVDEKLRNERKKGEVYPTNTAPVIKMQNNILTLTYQQWGFPHFNHKGVIINARSETALNKNLFRTSLLTQRCIIPAGLYYEWDESKIKYEFKRADNSVMYFAGFYNNYNTQNAQIKAKYIILTTKANQSVRDIHDRMPLILDGDEITDWLSNTADIKHYLNKIPCTLSRYTENEQLKLNL